MPHHHAISPCSINRRAISRVHPTPPNPHPQTANKPNQCKGETGQVYVSAVKHAGSHVTAAAAVPIKERNLILKSVAHAVEQVRQTKEAFSFL